MLALPFRSQYEFIHGRRHSLDPRNRRSLDLALRLPDELSSAARAWRLDDLAWSSAVVRRLITLMLERSNAGPAQLMRAWGGRHGLRREEFVECVREGIFAAVSAEEQEELEKRTACAVAAAETDDEETAAQQRLSEPERGQGGGVGEYAGGAGGGGGGGERDTSTVTDTASSAAARKLTDLTDLWEAEVRAAVHVCFDELMRLVRGQNFTQRIGIVQLERWLNDGGGGTGTGTRGGGGGGCDGGGGGDGDVDTGWATLLKTPQQRHRQQLRRAERDRLEEERAAQLAEAPKRVDWAAQARAGIRKAAASCRERERMTEASSREQRRLGAISPTESRALPLYLPPPLTSAPHTCHLPPHAGSSSHHHHHQLLPPPSPRTTTSSRAPPRPTPRTASPGGLPSPPLTPSLRSSPPTAPSSPHHGPSSPPLHPIPELLPPAYSARGLSPSPRLAGAPRLGILPPRTAATTRESSMGSASIAAGSDAGARVRVVRPARPPTTLNGEGISRSSSGLLNDAAAFFSFQLQAFAHTERMRQQMEIQEAAMRAARTTRLRSATSTTLRYLNASEFSPHIYTTAQGVRPSAVLASRC